MISKYIPSRPYPPLLIGVDRKHHYIISSILTLYYVIYISSTIPEQFAYLNDCRRYFYSMVKSIRLNYLHLWVHLQLRPFCTYIWSAPKTSAILVFLRHSAIFSYNFVSSIILPYCLMQCTIYSIFSWSLWNLGTIHMNHCAMPYFVLQYTNFIARMI